MRAKAPKSLIYQSNLIFQSAPKSPVCFFHGGTFGKLPPKRLIYEAVFLRIFPKSPGCFTHVENSAHCGGVLPQGCPAAAFSGAAGGGCVYSVTPSGGVSSGTPQAEKAKKYGIRHTGNLVVFPETFIVQKQPPKRPPANIRALCWTFSGYKMGLKKSIYCLVVFKEPF